jgi:hypothetical protein
MENSSENIIEEKIPVEPNKGKIKGVDKSVLFLTFSLLLLIIIGSVSAFAIYNKIQENPNNHSNQGKHISVSQTITPTVAANVTPLAASITLGGLTINASTKPQFINNSVGLLNKSVVMTGENADIPTTFIEYDYYAGIVQSGSYKGYYEVIAGQDTYGFGGGPNFFVFVTENGSSFVGDKTNPSFTVFGKANSTDSMNVVNSSLVTSTDDIIDSQFPQEIKLKKNYSLVRMGLNYNNILVPSNQSNSYLFDTDYSSYIPINTTVDSLKLYAPPTSKKSIIYFNEPGEPYQNLPSSVLPYIQTSTDVYAVNSYGIGYLYNLSSNINSTVYVQGINIYNTQEQAYQNAVNSNASPLPQQPSYPQAEANLSFNGSEVKTSQQLYTSYNVAFPGICAAEANTEVLQNISVNNLTQIGTLYGNPVYSLTDPTNPLVKYEYQQKITSPLAVAGSDSNFEQLNNVSSIPTIQQYISKNPLLILQDPFGRLVMLGEYQYLLPGGCGKPVIYIYSPKTTNVHLQFASDIKLDVNIPKYTNGWDVKTNSNGTLTDLQPQYTDCTDLNTFLLGSGYAKNACEENQYPYIYWSGQSIGKQMPQIETGWDISRSNLTSFMNEKLDYMGFTTKEKNDMLSYWLPVMLSENTPYYEISFLRTEQMNEIAPMEMTPKPESFFRVFLDYHPLSEMPAIQLPPEQLEKIQRNGLTYIEWGGIELNI